MKRIGALAVIAVAISGCYHATIETGLAPSNRKVEKHWASGWIGGLVPPSYVETVEQCSEGVARVETKLSFLNQLVAGLTLGIYTPMYIEITCAEGVRNADAAESPEVEIGREATMEEKRAALREAAALSARLGSAVTVTF